MRKISVALILAVASLSLSVWATAVKSNPGTPTSADVTITGDRRSAEEDTYYFTMRLPEYAGKKFAMVSLTEMNRDTGAAQLQFDLSKTKAFKGTPEQMNHAIGIETWADETGTIWVEFDPALNPRATVTIAFAVQKPASQASYEYGIAAYPKAENSVAVFVGNGTLTVGQ